MTDGRAVEIKFDQQSSEAVLTITFDAEKENPIEMQEEGWKAILKNYKHYAERQ